VEQPPVYYPVCLNIEGKRCVVVGGGDVAARKVKALLDARADVAVVSQDVCDEIAACHGVTISRRQWRESDLDGAFVVIAATNDRSLNATIARAARERRVLCNVVDDAGLSDFIMPATVRRGPLLIAVSTSGALPALARSVRERLETTFGHEYADYLEIISEMRQDIIGSVSDEAARREIFDRFADPEFVVSIRDKGKEHIREQLESVVRDVARKYQGG
jgi:precorrin-2 dehydrogenase/sirohydrochlorin ferrochelatase